MAGSRRITPLRIAPRRSLSARNRTFTPADRHGLAGARLPDAGVGPTGGAAPHSSFLPNASSAEPDRRQSPAVRTGSKQWLRRLAQVSASQSPQESFRVTVLHGIHGRSSQETPESR